MHLSAAHAEQSRGQSRSISFDTPLTALQKSLISSFSASSDQALWASIDLNDDGVNEFIEKPQYCKDTQPHTCKHNIYAQTPHHDFVKIGDISSLRLALGSQRTFGVRDLIGYSDLSNDYNAIFYIWDNAKSYYTEKP